MANMSYCRFQNTVSDLRDCGDKLEEIEGDLSQLSDEERRAARRLISLCALIAESYGVSE